MAALAQVRGYPPTRKGFTPALGRYSGARVNTGEVAMVAKALSVDAAPLGGLRLTDGKQSG